MLTTASGLFDVTTCASASLHTTVMNSTSCFIVAQTVTSLSGALKSTIRHSRYRAKSGEFQKLSCLATSCWISGLLIL